MSVTVSVTGGDALLRKLTVMPERAKEQVRTVMAQQADEIVEMMKRLVPVDQGDLRDSIAWRWGSRAPKGAMAIGTVGAKGSDMTVTIYATDFKARWIEFSTVKMPAQPFFFPSWRASKKGSVNKIRAAVRKAAKQVAAS